MLKLTGNGTWVAVVGVLVGAGVTVADAGGIVAVGLAVGTGDGVEVEPLHAESIRAAAAKEQMKYMARDLRNLSMETS